MRAAGQFDCVVDMICFTPADAESLLRAVRGRTNHLIMCSTVDVYVKPYVHYPVREDHPLQGASAYGKDKARCEAMLMEAHRQGIVPVTILRPAQTYGEGRDIIHVFGRSIGVFKRLREGRPVIVHGDGSSLWAACYTEDVARGFVGAAANERTFGKAYNVAGEEWTTWDGYTASLAEGLGAPPPMIVHIPTDLLTALAPQRSKIIVENFRFNNIFDNAAAHTDLGFQVTVPFVEGVRRTAAWLDARGRVEASDGDPWQDRLIDAWQRLSTRMVEEVGSQDL